MLAIFVRHAESLNQTGSPASDRTQSGLSPNGIEQALDFADTVTAPPNLIVVSPFKRSQQTAQAVMKRFPDVPAQIWEIEEFEYLAPERWAEAAHDRQERVEEYWAAADPKFKDGPDAESFSHLLRRTELALRKLTALPIDWTVMLFSHYDFMHALEQTVTLPELSDAQKMQRYIEDTRRAPFQNTGTLVLERSADTAWRVGKVQQ